MLYLAEAMLISTEVSKKAKFLETIAKISSFWKKLENFHVFRKKLKNSQ